LDCFKDHYSHEPSMAQAHPTRRRADPAKRGGKYLHFEPITQKIQSKNG
jgi:hypothetical protein